ncbi:Crp/Fnr family transcriptional regulator [Deinococcus cellulosilyticus]|uniref:HTH crp-type domain-containing protein n=1 Tax=Deinococcus cellulosilyticus (strain DSM 18568 / NBRC 106333 / KACC 11606 / 5516J-15) TaxID=1223518 RepID=A0A511N712_DEIC1|nr:helix-turn-helix domain-containing protein [Deinococcus cellulosilyticus]GEM48639.1 hypothetical protein DC3_42740 [Deinococcus cellulosilyticus NBRC 106333 = KACC 11606]
MQLRKGEEFVFCPQENQEYVVKSGVLVRPHLVSDRMRVHVQYLLPGDVFGRDVLASGRMDQVVYEALTPAEVLSSGPDGESVARQLDRSMMIAGLLSVPVAITRVAAFLLWASGTPLFSKVDGALVCNLSHEVLSECVRLGREHTTKVLNEVQGCGGVKLGYRRLELTDFRALEDLVHQHN